MSGEGGRVQLRREFASDVLRRISELGRAVDKRDLERARRLSHALTGSARVLALDALVRELERLDQLLAQDAAEPELVAIVESVRRVAVSELLVTSEPATEPLERLSHDLRTPLGAVAGFTQLLRRSGLTPEQERLVDGIAEGVERLVAVLDDALRVSRPDELQRSGRGGDPAGPAGMRRGTGSEPITIVYVEDDPASAAVVATLLEHRPDVNLVVAVTGAEGLALAAEMHPDLVLLDLGLPDIEGTEVFRLLRAAAPAAPVAVLSGDTRPERVAELREAGADDYLAKPIDLQRLLDLVDELAHA